MMVRRQNAVEPRWMPAMLLVAAFVFVFSWFLRFNDPGGTFAGLTDDHFFYLVRGWQILFGDLPVRDFVDHGAPLYYYIAAAVQVVFGRGTLSELAFSTTMIAAGAALTFWLAARASGSILLGLVGAAFEILLAPRFYNYPKILVYAAAIALLWSFAERTRGAPRTGLAVLTVVAFLLRHDHGFFVALAFFVLVLLLPQLTLRDRLRHLLLYGVVTVAVLAPYLAFIEMNGGVVSYLQQASAWAARDRDRAPVVWPGLVDNAVGSGEGGFGEVVASMRANTEAWLFYFELALPVFALGILACCRNGTRPDWPQSVPKIAVVIALGIVLDVGFLRSPLRARLADPSVPLSVLLAWMCRAVPLLLVRRDAWAPRFARRFAAGRALLAPIAVAFLIVPVVTLSADVYDRLDAAALVEGPSSTIAHSKLVVQRLREEWQLSTWKERSDRSDVLTLSLYLNTCTRPTDRVFMQPYLPQVPALARRGFAGGHADLRPGFFATEDAQELTLSRLERQSVPIAILETDDSYRNFRESFPLITAYFDRNYRIVETRRLDHRFGITLLARNDLPIAGTFEPFGWPCFTAKPEP